VIVAYAELVGICGKVRSKRSEIERAARAELGAARQRSDLVRGLEQSRDLEFVRFVLEEERDALLHNALVLSGILYGSLDVKPVFWALTEGSAEKRAEAVEVLDNVLQGTLRDEMIALLEPGEGAGPPPAALDETLGGLLRDVSSEWLMAGAAYAVGRRGLAGSLPALRAALGHSSAHVREAALDAIGRLAPAVPA